jgi:PIN like domain
VIFYLDASIPFPVSKALTLVRDDVLYPGAKDAEWLPTAGRHGWVVLMRDKRVRSRPGERQALVKSNVRAFVLTTAGNYTRWQTLDLLVRRWADIEEIVATDEPPYIYAVRQQGLRRIPLGSN